MSTVSQVITWTPAMAQPRYLGMIGHLGQLTYSYALPGGCDQLTATLAIPADWRTDAMDPGRIVQVIRGGSVVWDGKMLEPIPTTGGWTITANGTGNAGANYCAYYTGFWNTNPDSSVNNAISRGLRWVNPGIGSPAGLWLGQSVDSASQFIDDLLNLCCSNGGYTWYVGRGNVLTVFALPTTVNRLLVADSPVPRTLGGDYNTIYERYQVSGDAGSYPSVYATTSSVDQPSITRFGEPMEDFIDLSSAGIMAAGAAQAVGAAILQRYQRASFGGPFTVRQGQLLTTAGAAVDLGQEQAGTVCRLILTDYAYGGEENPGPVEFLVGNYEYDEDAQTGTVTPFQSLGMSMENIVTEPWATVTRRADRRYARKVRRRERKHPYKRPKHPHRRRHRDKPDGS